MIFQPFQGMFFYNEQLYPLLNTDCDKTWSYDPTIGDKNVDYASVITQGKPIIDLCPANYQEQYEFYRKKIKSIIKSYAVAGITLKKQDLKTAIPKNFVKKFLSVRNLICEKAFEKHKKPLNYDLLLDIHKYCVEASQKPIKLNFNNIDSPNVPLKDKERLSNTSGYISFDPFKTVTGRLATRKGSFPILNLKKELRGVVEPYNDCLVELDFNAAELRVLLALSGGNQPERDIHQWNAENIFKDKSLTRGQIKEKTFSWLYNKKAVDLSLETCYNRNLVFNKFFQGAEIKTFFNRKIKSDPFHALNYIIQSTSSDLFFKQLGKIRKFLKNKKTRIYFSMHDSLVLDFDSSEKHYLKDLIQIFSETDLGKFKINVSVGRNFGNMKELILK